MNNNTNKKELSIPYGLIIVVVWAMILMGLMFNTIKKYTNYDDNYIIICNNDNC